MDWHAKAPLYFTSGSCGDFISIADIDDQKNGNNSHGGQQAEKSSRKKADENDGNASKEEGDAAKALALFPCKLVFHAPLCSKADHRIHPQLRHDISDDDHKHAQKTEEKLIEIQRNRGQIFHLVKRCIQEINIHDVENRQDENAGNHNDLFIVFSVLFLLRRQLCHEEKKISHEQRGDGINQGFVFAAPAGDLIVSAVVGGYLFRQKGQCGEYDEKG